MATNVSFSINKQTLLGKVGRDLEKVVTNNGNTIGNFSLATDYSYKKGDSYERQTTWHRIKIFNPSTFLENAIKKGATLYIEGRTTTDEYVDKNGEKRSITYVIADHICPVEVNGYNNNSSTPAVNNTTASEQVVEPQLGANFVPPDDIMHR